MPESPTWTPPEVSQPQTSWVPPEVISRRSEAVPSPSVAPQQVSTPSKDILHWEPYFNGTGDLEKILPKDQVDAFKALAKNNPEQKDGGARRAIVKAFLTDQLPETKSLIDRNLDVVASAYGQQNLGIKDHEVKAEDLYDSISAHIKSGQAEAHRIQRMQDARAQLRAYGEWMMKHGPESAMRQWEDFWKPNAPLPEMKVENLPPSVAVPMYDPELIAGVWNGGIKPALDSMTSTGGAAAMVATSGLSVLEKAVVAPYAAKALTGIKGFFTAMMAKSLYEQTPEVMRVLNDPKSTREQKIAAVSGEVTTGLFTVATGLSTALDLLPAERRASVANKVATSESPADAANILRVEANRVPVDEKPQMISAAGLLDGMYPEGSIVESSLKIEAAAKMAEDGTIIEGVSHDKIAAEGKEGFTLSNGEFVGSREEAMKIARASGQLLEDVPPETTELHSHMVDMPIKAETVQSEVAAIDSAPASEHLTSVKKASVNTQLKRMGFDPVTPSETKTWSEGVKGAMDRFEKDPERGANLVRRALAGETRFNTEDVWDSQVYQRQLEDAVVAAEKRYDEALRSGDEKAMAAADAELYDKQATLKQASQAFNEVMGSEAGRALNARKAMLREDYSPAALERKWRKSTGKAEVPENVQKELKDKADKIAELEDLLKKSVESRAKARPPTPARSIPTLRERISIRADEARTRLLEKAGRVSAGIDPTDIADYAAIAADHIASGLDASAELVKQFGEAIKPHLEQILEKAKALVPSGFEEKPIDYSASLGLRILRGMEKPEGLGPRPTVIEIARWFQDKVEEPISFESATKEQEARLVHSIIQETKSAFKIHPEAAGWYDENVRLMLKVMQEIDPDLKKPENDFILKALLAVTSDGNLVDSQFKQSWETYKHWKETGELTGQFVSGKSISNIRGNIEMLNALISDKGLIETRDWLFRKGRVKEIRQAAISELGFTKEEAAKIGTGESVDTVVPYAVIFGPKLGSFFNNLYGDFSTITMDRWFMRTMGRLTGTQVESIPAKKMAEYQSKVRAAFKDAPDELKAKLGLSEGDFEEGKIDESTNKIANYFTEAENRKGLTEEGNALRKAANNYAKALEPLVESPQNASHRTWIRGVFERVQDQLRKEGIALENADLQALLWYGEKELYESLGYRSRSGAADYAAAAESVYAGERGGSSRAYAEGTGRVGGIGRGGVDTGRAGEAAKVSSIVERLSSKADEARARLAKKAGRLSAGIDPTDIADYAIVAADYIAKGIKEGAELSKKLIEDFGDAIRPHLDDIIAKARSEFDLESKRERSLKAWRTRTQKEIARLEAREPKPERVPLELPYTPEDLKLKERVETLKKEVAAEFRANELARRPAWLKGVDKVKWVGETAILSSLNILLKIPASAAWKTLFAPAKEVFGVTAGKVFPEAARYQQMQVQPTYAQMLATEAKAAKATVTEGMRAAGEAALNRLTQEEKLFVPDSLPPEAKDFMRSVHRALHLPAQINAFTRVVDTIENNMKSQGLGHTLQDPAVWTAIRVRAYNEAYRAAYLEKDTLMSGVVNAAIRSIEQRGKGKSETLAALATMLIELDNPVKRVPVNVIGQIGETAFGLPMGTLEIFNAYRKGFEGMKKGDLDAAFRRVKNGSVGALAMLGAWYAYENIGGSKTSGSIYDKPEKRRKPGMPAEGQVKVGEITLPELGFHNETWAAAQMMASYRHLLDSQYGKGAVALDSDAILRVILGEIKDMPGLKQSIVTQMAQTKEPTKTASQWAASRAVPGAVAQIARWLDTPGDISLETFMSQPTKRYPRTGVEEFKTRIPGLREEVPTRRQPTTSYRQ